MKYTKPLVNERHFLLSSLNFYRKHGDRKKVELLQCRLWQLRRWMLECRGLVEVDQAVRIVEG